MPTVKIGDHCKLKRIPLFSQIPDWGDERKIPAFDSEQIFEVIDIDKKVTLQAVKHSETRFFEWFKNAVIVIKTEVLSELSELPAPADPVVARFGPKAGDLQEGDRIKLKPGHLPNYEDINPNTSRRGIPVCTEDDVFEVEGVRGSRIMISQGGEPFEWYAHAIKSIIKPQQPSDAVLRNAGEIVSGLSTSNGRGYRPSNGTEGEFFRSRWCDRCEKDLNDDCQIYAHAMIGRPVEWIYWGDKPVCTAWELRTTPPKVESPSIVCVVRSDGTRTAIVSEPQPESKEVESSPKSKPLKTPKTDYPFTTPWTPYRDMKYRIEGDPKDGIKGEYYYVIDRDGKKTRSEKSYGGIIPCNADARKAIDALASVIC